MPSATTVIATGEIKRIWQYLTVEEVPYLVVMQISVLSIRELDGLSVLRPETLTITIDREQAANCSEFLQEGRSVGAMVELSSTPTQSKGVGRAAAVYFLGRSSWVSPLPLPRVKTARAGHSAQPALAA